MAIGKKTGGGTRLGSPNKVTASIKAVFEEAFRRLQESDTANLDAWAEANPTEFYRLSAKLIPAALAVQGDLRTQVKIVSEFDFDAFTDLVE